MESVLWPRYISLKPRLWNWWHVSDMIGFGNKPVQGQEGTRQIGHQIITQIECRWNGLWGDSAETHTVHAEGGNEGSLWLFCPLDCFITAEGHHHRGLYFWGWERRSETWTNSSSALVIREGITISFVRKLFGEQRERGRTKRAIAALRVPLLSFSFNKVGSLPVFEPWAGPQLASSVTHRCWLTNCQTFISTI